MNDEGTGGSRLERFIAAMDGLNERIGALASAMTFGTAFLCFATVFLRDALKTSCTWLVEAYIWQRMLVILLGAGDTFQNGGFVRVDLFYARMSRRGRAVVDLLGQFLFLIPFTAAAAWSSWTFRAAVPGDPGALAAGGRAARHPPAEVRAARLLRAADAAGLRARGALQARAARAHRVRPAAGRPLRA